MEQEFESNYETEQGRVQCVADVLVDSPEPHTGRVLLKCAKCDIESIAFEQRGSGDPDKLKSDAKTAARRFLFDKCPPVVDCLRRRPILALLPILPKALLD